MIDTEKHAYIIERNARICAHYQSGQTLASCASHFRLGRQRILQILKQAGAWQPYVKGNRTKFLGVNVSELTKEGLTKMAEQKGVSVSKLASGALDVLVKP